MKILVTGGAGFIGSHLINKLIELGHDVNVLDNLTIGDKSRVNEKANFIKGDIREELDIKKSMNGCEAVFHLAAISNVRESNEDENFKINYIGARNVFIIAKKLGAKIIFTSSAAVYGNAKIPNKENIECNPISDYGKNKLKAEKFLENAFIVRMFNVYGPNGNSVINDFCKKTKIGKKITVFGSGMQTRDYIHVDDIVEALIIGLDNEGIYNIANGEEISLLSVIDEIENTSGEKIEPEFTIPNESEIKRSKADISAIKSLGWEPNVNLKEGIKSIWSSL